MRFSRPLFTALYAAAVALALAVPRPMWAQDCTPGECCAARPTYTDINYSYTGGIVVATREPEAGNDAVLTIFDITQPYPGNGVNYAAVLRYHGPSDSWNEFTLGSVFGVTIDKYANILVTNSTAYNYDATGPGGYGAVYRVANGSGATTTFCTLPNSFGVGLGNISYDCANDQFFVTNHEDGKIYRIKTAVTNGPVATIQESFDPLLPDDGTTGFAPLGERLWAVQWHAGRVYYSVWSENCNETGGPANTIRSVALVAGAFDASSDQLEITMPPHVNGYSHPVADISFTRKGTMLTAERSMYSPTTPAAHESRLLEWECADPGGLPGWSASANTYVLGVSATCCCSGIAGNGTNSSGGVDTDFAPYSPATPFGRVWGTSDAINGSLTVYGIQGLPPNGGIPSQSAWIDMDGSAAYSEKTSLGDVEVPCPDLVTSTALTRFTVEPKGTALELRWAFSEPVLRAELERADRAEGPWTSVGGGFRFENDETVFTDRDVEPAHTYWYRLIAAEQTFGPMSGTTAEAIANFALALTSENPTDGAVRLEFALPRDAKIRVSVLDVSGRVIETLANGTYEAGRHTVTWNANRKGAPSSGIYFVRYQTPEGSFTKQVVVTP